MPFKESKRLHYLGDVATFEKSMHKVSLHDVVAERDAEKAKVRAENERKLKAIRAKSTSK